MNTRILRRTLGAAILIFLGPVLPGPAARAAAAPEERWSVVILGGTPVGYVRENMIPAAAGARISETEMKMVLNRLGSKVELDSLSRTEETSEGRLSAVAYEMRASVLSTRSRAVVKDGTIEIRSEAGGKSYTRSIPYTGILLGPEGVRRLSLENIKKPGDRIEYRTFASETETVSAGSQTALAWETITVGGREIRALKVEETLEAAGGKSLSWLDEARESVRQEMPTPFGTAQITVSTREQALAAAAGGTLPEEIYAHSILKTGVRLPRARTLEYLKLRITRRDPGGEWPDISGPTQKVAARTAATLDLELRPAKPKADVLRPAAVSEADREFLAPNASIQSDDPALKRTALEIVGGETRLWPAALKLRRWVSENMRFDLGIAFAPSTELFKNRRGTCVGYATLLATLARAAGIPARVSIGYAYVLGMFGGHAWAEVLVGDEWVPLDAALLSPGVSDPARFYLGRSSLNAGTGSLTGGPTQQLMGQIDVRVLAFSGPDGRIVDVPEGAAPYTIQGDVYANPWLGLEITKPAGWSFVKADAVWPDAAVIGLEGPGGATAEWQEAYLTPWLDADAALRQTLARHVPKGRERRMSVSGRSALILESAEGAALALADGPEAWVLVVKGKGAAATLVSLATGIRLAPRRSE